MTVLGTATNDNGVPVFPQAHYTVRLKGVDPDVESDFAPAGQIKWVFIVEAVMHSSDPSAESFVGQELHGYSRKSLHGYGPKHKTRQWYEALLGRPLAEGEAIDIAKVIGARAVATVVPHQRRDGTPTSKIAQEGGLQPYLQKGRESGPDLDPQVTF